MGRVVGESAHRHAFAAKDALLLHQGAYGGGGAGCVRGVGGGQWEARDAPSRPPPQLPII